MKTCALKLIFGNLLFVLVLCPLLAQVHGVKDDVAISKYSSFLEPNGEIIWALKNRTFEMIDELTYVEKIYHPEKVVMTHFIQYADLNRAVRSGAYFEWYDNSTPRVEGQYENNQRVSTWYFYEFGKDYITSMGGYVDDKREGTWQELDSMGLIRIESTYSNNLLHGEQITYHEDGRTSILKSFEDGNPISTKYIDTIGLESHWLRMKSAPYLEDCGVPAILNKMDGCTHRMWRETIFTELEYPQSARGFGVEGKAIFLIKCTREGEIRVLKTLVGLTEDIENECKRVLAKSPRFKPAMQQGQTVEFVFEFPVEFKLE